MERVMQFLIGGLVAIGVVIGAVIGAIAMAGGLLALFSILGECFGPTASVLSVAAIIAFIWGGICNVDD